ncbi:MAG TPA: carboxypeptidase-like regulatory domain-containing protein [Flavipsychrobacter sp.]|nr:carboxypeptidase-like regulatory domain-containing protein [Flavipsychrobacter sp.]
MRSLLILLFFLPVFSFATSITGEIIDGNTRQAVGNVNILNIYTEVGTVSDEVGRFSIIVAKGQLLEFRKVGYKTLRIRIPEGQIPPYFKVIMQQGPVELPQFDLHAQSKDWKRDSTRYYELYKGAIEFEKLDGLDVIRHPFSALSKRNRQIWAFQKEYNFWEQQKFIDYTFNERLVTNLSGLSGDSLQVYMKRYRPSYEFLRSMNEYAFYSYIKESTEFFRTGRRKYTPVIRRSAN